MNEFALCARPMTTMSTIGHEYLRLSDHLDTMYEPRSSRRSLTGHLKALSLIQQRIALLVLLTFTGIGLHTSFTIQDPRRIAG